MTKQTALEFLVEQVSDAFRKSDSPIIEQAKAIEKQQIIDAVVWFDDTDRKPNEIEKDAEQYYEQTYTPSSKENNGK